MSYSIPTPEGNTIIESRPAMLSDDTFDGEKTATGFTQGLGQLADGVQGEDIQIVRILTNLIYNFHFVN